MESEEAQGLGCYYSYVLGTPASKSPEHRHYHGMIQIDSSATAGPATWMCRLENVDMAEATFAWHFIMGGKRSGRRARWLGPQALLSESGAGLRGP